MGIQTLKNNLLESYTTANLNIISVVLLDLYKNQQFGTLQKIDDLRLLENLGMIEMLNLSDNRISDIDSLEYLTNLRELNLANNRIQDISPLFSLENLEFVDLTGNKIPIASVEKLREKGIILVV